MPQFGPPCSRKTVKNQRGPRKGHVVHARDDCRTRHEEIGFAHPTGGKALGVEVAVFQYLKASNKEMELSSSWRWTSRKILSGYKKK